MEFVSKHFFIPGEYPFNCAYSYFLFFAEEIEKKLKCLDGNAEHNAAIQVIPLPSCGKTFIHHVRVPSNISASWFYSKSEKNLKLLHLLRNVVTLY
jgi:hypothetical protein